MENINFRGIPTSLFLNGPKLGIVTDPQSVSDAIGVATFTGIATATFLDNNFDFDGGSIAFKWYFDGSQILDTSVDINSNAEIIGFSSATGTGSTITINGLTTDDSGKEIYFEADYVPSAYQTTSPVTAGTARSTGNAFNEPLQSGIATVTVKPIIEITSQPEDKVVGRTFAAEYSIAARTTPGNGSVNYQWQLNGNDLSDGTTTTTVNTSGTGQIEITNSVDSTTEVIDFSQVSTYSNFNPGVTYTLKSNTDITTSLLLFGAGGGGSDARSVPGSKGGVSEGTFTFVKDQEYKLILGIQGDIVTGGDPGGGRGGGTAGTDGRGGGGGYTGLFLGSITHANAIIMAGGGGGSTGDPARGGAGGDEVGGAGNNPISGRGGGGGSQTAGGAGLGDSVSGSALEGGDGVNAGGGGGGYYGGGGGNPSSTVSDGAGGGGSGYIHPTLITDGRTFKRDDEYIGSSDNLVYPGGTSKPGEFRIELVSSSKEVTTTITGATTQNLSITTDDAAAGVIRCKVTADDVQESPVFSKSVSYYVVAIRNVLKIEQYKYSDESVIFSEHDLSNGSLSLSADTHEGNDICLYAAEQDINVEIDMYGGKGSNNGSYSGGEGGYSKIRFTMEKDVEYILTGLFSTVNAPFLYRKATLIAVVGEGGDAGVGGHGGDGGGINVKGEDTTGGSGNGGDLFAAGTLPSNGYYGSLTTLNAVTPDTEATGVDGGRTIPCTRGVYWRNQGKSPCEDLGTIKFRSPDGTVMDRSTQSTAEIDRGYKAGYNIIQTKGAQDSGAGQGGSGALGGMGGTANGGGGGGSGYTDGSVTVVKTTQGGSIGPARININLSTSDFFIDDQGRILILSNTDNRDPRTLTKTTSKVLPNTNTCIDDARWQRFLDFARDGTQDYRLTATENNSSVKIVNATEKNIYTMMNGNALTLRDSLTGWVDSNYAYTLLALAWDETSNDGMSGYGGDYSILSWSPTSNHGHGYYGSSSNPFFTPTTYNHYSANWWILPPGVPDF